jgi:hypothetical protein
MNRSTGILSFDDSHPHLCVVTLGNELEDRDIADLYERTLRVFARRRHVVLLVDARNSQLTARQRKLMVAHMKEHEDEFHHWVVGSALVIESALARGTLTALMWMSSPPYEQKAFRTLDAARAWALERVADVERRERAVQRDAGR